MFRRTIRYARFGASQTWFFARLSVEFDSLYSASGRPSVPPECVLRALLLQVFYSIHSERQLVEKSSSICPIAGSSAWAWTTRSGTRPSSRKTVTACSPPTWRSSLWRRSSGRAKSFLSDDHFTVDSTLIQAWASQKSFRKEDGWDGDRANFYGHKRKNDTHEWTTDPDARLYKKSYGTESKLAYLGHALMENRNSLLAAAMATLAQCEATLLMLAERQEGRSRRITVGADKACDASDLVTAARALT